VRWILDAESNSAVLCLSHDQQHSAPTVKTHYKRLAMLVHPDKSGHRGRYNDWLLDTSISPEKRVSIGNGELAYGDIINPFSPGGVYVARLISLVHALLCVPASWALRVVCTQGAIDATLWFALAQTDRHRLNMCGRPILTLLHQILNVRRRRGGTTELVRFVAEEASPVDTAGMKLAKAWADRGRCQAQDPSTRLPDQAGEQFLSCMVDFKPVLGRVRLAVRAQLHCDVFKRWQKSKSQGRFCSDAAPEFIKSLRAVIADGHLGPRFLPFGLRLLTDTVQFCMIDDGDARSFSTTPCLLCDDALDSDVDHLFTCSDAMSIQARASLVRRILDELITAKGSGPWIARQRNMPLMSLIRRLFSAEDSAVRLRLAFGCCSSNELSGAMSDHYSATIACR